MVYSVTRQKKIFSRSCAFVVVAFALVTAAFAETRLDSLSAHGVVYSNITIVGKTATHVEFKHAHGFASVKVKTLPQDVQLQLGYTPPPPRKNPLDVVTKDFSRNLLADAQFKE